MSKTPELVPDQSAKILPILWIIFLVTAAFIIYFYVNTGLLAKKIMEPINNYIENLVPTSYPTTAPLVTKRPSPTIVRKLSPTPTKIVVTCFRVNIREGEFASNKCYSRADANDLNYYLQRFDAANFDLQTAQGSINITCNCRVPKECEFFKDSCANAQQQKTKAETDINKYWSTIRSIISKGK